MLNYFGASPAELTCGAEERIDSIPLLTADEERQLLIDWNDTHAGYAGEPCLHHLFEYQVGQSPDATAISFQSKKLTYRELDARASRLANYLVHLGAGPEVLVGVCVERSERMVIALLAVLKAGAAYVPLDPSHPIERLRFMLQDAGVRVLLTENRLTSLFPDFQGQVVRLEEDWEQRDADTSIWSGSEVGSRNLAYVIYTSGSTGQPHGVTLEHGSVVNCLLSMQTEPGLCSADRLLAITTICFDIAVLELFLPLSVGAELVIASREVATDGLRLGSELTRWGITAMQATPATWRMLLASGWRGEQGLKALCGGEALSRELASELVRRTKSVWNLYGPTETTIWSTATRVEDGSGPVPIGRPIANTRVYILDQQYRPEPIGVPGELYIGGNGLARGYWNLPELTSQRFVEIPFERNRAYKTGDIARYRADGQIEYLGRRDFQIKLRGHRIELAEIESAIRVTPGVKEAAVAVRDLNGEKQLIAYLECEQYSAPEVKQIRQTMKGRLPEYMLPRDYVLMEKLPLTPNGKIDRKALPEPGLKSQVGSDSVSPRGGLDRDLTAIWEDVLGVRPIGADDNFFDLGGHSLLAAQLISKIESVTGYNLPVAALFQAPTVESLADTIRGRTWDRGWSPVIELQRGTSVPFFCVHSLGANLVSYQKLASLSGSNQRFYGLQPYGLNGQQEPQDTIEDMARAYVSEILRIQPTGPYRVGGVCLGGVVSFEMAQQLNALGEQVSLLLLIDSEFPGTPEHLKIRPYKLSWADHHIDQLLNLTLTGKARYILRKMCDAAIRAVKRSLPDNLGESTESSLTRATRRVMEVNLRALLNYTPKRYPGKVTLFCCSEKSIRTYEDRRLAWSQVADGGLEVHLIPGNHLSMVDQPHVQKMAEELRTCLERARPGE